MTDEKLEAAQTLRYRIENLESQIPHGDARSFHIRMDAVGPGLYATLFKAYLEALEASISALRREYGAL